MTPPDDDDLVAAEYALGTLDPAERAAATVRRAGDAAFDAAVSAWEARLSALSEATPEADPSPSVWTGVVARLNALAGAPPTVVAFDGEVAALRRQLRRWRAMTTAAAALAAALALWIGVDTFGPGHPPRTELVAFLQPSGEQPAFVMGVSLSDERLSVRPVSGRPPAGKAYELWIIDPAMGPPRSLGVLKESGETHPVPAAIPREILSRATYAITVEEPGGSATGAPSGAPVFTGHLVEAPR